MRNHLTQELAEELKLFRYERSADGGVRVLDHDIDALRETVLAPKYNFGAPAVLAKHIANDGSLTLMHEHETDGRGLDLDRAERVLDYLHKVWRRPIRLETVDAAGQARTLSRVGRLTSVVAVQIVERDGDVAFETSTFQNVYLSPSSSTRRMSKIGLL